MTRRSFLGATGAALLLGAVGLPAAARTPSNPLLAPWPGPHGGVPPLDQVRPEMFGPALESAIAEYRQELAAIAANAEPATFANTLAALEDSGRAYRQVHSVFEIFTATMNSPEIQALEREWAPKFAALHDEVVLNPDLFARVRKVHEGCQGLDPERRRLTWRHYTDFVRSGAALDPEAKKKLAGFNERLAHLYTEFGQNLLADEEGQSITLSGPEELAGLPTSMVNPDGPTVIRNTRSSAEPFLTFSDRRDLREKVWRMWASRGEARNHPIAAEILRLRARRARLLGYETHAHWRLENTMAGTPQKAMDLLLQVWKPAVARVHEEVADMQALAGHAIEPWDYRYYAEKVRKAKYDLDASEIEPYLQLEKMQDAQFWVAEQLYGLKFRQVQGIPVQHPDIRVCQVSDARGAHVGYWYFDPFARDGKRSGAWMSEYRTQERFAGQITPIVSNNANYVKPKPGEAVLISWDDAETMFHEFGHALHGLASNVTYPTLAGTYVAQDFVEFPSQVNEHWLATPEVLNRFAIHHESGQPMPADLVQRIQKAATFNQGFLTVEYLASAIVDMALHLAGDREIDTRAFEKKTLADLGMPSQIVMRHRIPHFAHVFHGDEYSAGYYSYLWSEVLDQDAWQAFKEADGPFDRKLARRLFETVLSVGDTVDPAQAYRNFRGRDPVIGPLLESRGFPVG